MKRSLACLLLLLSTLAAAAAEKFDVLVARQKLDGNLITGVLIVNGESLGTTYERNDLKIAAGSYPGRLRYGSKKGFAQGPFGELAEEGDFLLEIGSVKWSDGRARSHLLFHGGNKPEHSKGCIMLGAVSKNEKGDRYLPPGHTLRKLRFKFYGTDEPIASPDKTITITVRDVPPPSPKGK